MGVEVTGFRTQGLLYYFRLWSLNYILFGLLEFRVEHLGFMNVLWCRVWGQPYKDAQGLFRFGDQDTTLGSFFLTRFSPKP